MNPPLEILEEPSIRATVQERHTLARLYGPGDTEIDHAPNEHVRNDPDAAFRMLDHFRTRWNEALLMAQAGFDAAPHAIEERAPAQSGHGFRNGAPLLGLASAAILGTLGLLPPVTPWIPVSGTALTVIARRDAETRPPDADGDRTALRTAWALSALAAVLALLVTASGYRMHPWLHGFGLFAPAALQTTALAAWIHARRTARGTSSHAPRPHWTLLVPEDRIDPSRPPTILRCAIPRSHGRAEAGLSARFETRDGTTAAYLFAPLGPPPHDEAAVRLGEAAAAVRSRLASAVRARRRAGILESDDANDATAAARRIERLEQARNECRPLANVPTRTEPLDAARSTAPLP